MKKGLLKRLVLISLIVGLLTISGSLVDFATAEGGIFQMTGNITIPEDKVINGNVDAMAGNIKVYGVVNGNVTAMAGTITIYGKVTGDVKSMAGNIYLEDGAEVIGDVTAMAGRVKKEDSAVISGRITELSDGKHDWHWNLDGIKFGPFGLPIIPWYLAIWGGLTGLLSWLALGVLIMFFFSTQIQKLAEAVVERPGYYFLLGLVGFLLSPFACLLLVITIVGIPLIPVLILLIIFGALFGQLAVARVIGDKVKEMFGFRYDTEMARVVVGIMAMFLITLIPVVGWVFFLITLCIGFGVALKNRFGIEKRSDKKNA